ncbi:hypothetical protein [Microbacterium sp. No. 7]|uniref:hypothetical protein n=1 Tax=Microbacterium sp. No. 7 TaxID=1714373 RepID=UPI000ADFBD21|nr:hypothetical protein [Microbacterium sp. No. 7]
MTTLAPAVTRPRYDLAERLAYGPSRADALASLQDAGDPHLLGWAERVARKSLTSQGYALRKSRRRNERAADYGTFRIVDTQTNAVIAGEPYGLSLAEVLDFADPGF